MVQFGDTVDMLAPTWAQNTASQLTGMETLFDAGQAFVRQDESYLAVNAAHHSSAHKQSDDTGFVLAENRQIVLGDAGRWGFEEDAPDRIYARSATAHNVLTVDDQDFDWEHAEPYGGGLEAAGNGSGWYVLVVRNPLLKRQGVTHRRFLIYRPGRTLIVLDSVQSTDTHEYVRHFHFGAGIDAEIRARRIVVNGPGIPESTLTDLSMSTTMTLDCGREDPRLGWTYPSDRQRTAVWTATFSSEATNATLASVFALGQASQQVTAAVRRGDQVEVKIDQGPNLRVTVKPPHAVVEVLTAPQRAQDSDQ
jgi:hypothetical protein